MRPGRRKKIKKTEKTYKFLTRMKGKMLFVFFIIVHSTIGCKKLLLVIVQRFVSMLYSI